MRKARIQERKQVTLLLSLTLYLLLPTCSCQLERRHGWNGSRDVAGYKKDLNVKFTGAYLDVTGDDSWKYAKTYQFRVMSPILEGEARSCQ